MNRFSCFPFSSIAFRNGVVWFDGLERLLLSCETRVAFVFVVWLHGLNGYSLSRLCLRVSTHSYFSESFSLSCYFFSENRVVICF